MARKKKKQDDQPVELQITNKMIRFGGDIYPLRNISHVRSVVLKPDYKNPVTPGMVLFALAAIVVGVLVGIGEILQASSLQTQLIVGLGSFAVGSLILVSCWRKRNPPPDEYGIQLATNAGAKSLFSSSNEDFIEMVVMRIVDVIEHGDRPTDVTVNIADQMIQDNSTTVNQQIVYDMRVQHLNLSTEDSEFLLLTFRPALERLAQELQSAGDQAALQGLQQITDEINSEKPNGGVIRAVWDKVSSVCSGYETVKTVAEIAGMVARVATMF
jgi:hypothetical protein